MTTPPTKPEEPPRGLLSQRSALILVIATLCGVTTAWLTYHENASLAGAALAGMTAFAGAAAVAHKLIGELP